MSSTVLDPRIKRQARALAILDGGFLQIGRVLIEVRPFARGKPRFGLEANIQKETARGKDKKEKRKVTVLSPIKICSDYE